MAYLAQEEKLKTRELWEEAFPEDSVSFTDYYYTEKIKDNRIMAVKDADGRIISMLHLNPYRVMVKNQIWRTDYIVGVATAANMRRKGYMRTLLTEMLSDMYKEGRQFCFLMPANEAIYQPFGFTYIFDQTPWRLKSRGDVERVPYDLERGSEHHLAQEIVDFMNSWLHKHYEVYTFRDEAYLETLQKELRSERGVMELLYNADRLIGIECTWGGEKPEQRMMLCDDSYREQQAAEKPAIMARIVHLPNFIKVIRLKKSYEKDHLNIRLTINDSICQENRGPWLWHLTPAGSVLEKAEDAAGPEAEYEQELSITIEALTAWLFGYLVPGDNSWMNCIQPLRGAFLDEVV